MLYSDYLLDFVCENIKIPDKDLDGDKEFSFLFDKDYMVSVFVDCIIDVFEEYEGTGKFSGGIWGSFPYGDNNIVPLDIEIYDDDGWVCCFGYTNKSGGEWWDLQVGLSFQWGDIKSYIRDKKISDLGL